MRKTRLLKEFLYRLHDDKYVVVYIDVQSVHRLDDAVLVSDKTLIDILAELVEGIGAPIGMALAIAITSIAKKLEKRFLKGKKVVIVIDDVARPLGLDMIETYAKNLLSLLEDLLYVTEVESAAVIATTSEGISRTLIARHSYARLFEIWNLDFRATQELLASLGANQTLWDDIWRATGGNPRSIVELWRLSWDLNRWVRNVKQSVSSLINDLIPTYLHELQEVVDDIDDLIRYPRLREKLLQFNLVIPIDRSCLGYTPPIDKELGIGRFYAWQIPIYRRNVGEILSEYTHSA